MKKTVDYWDTYNHYTKKIIPAVGIERVREVYRDALFCVYPHDRLQALEDAIADSERASQ